MIGELLGPASALMTGVLLGVLFFGGLWLTVRRGLASRRAALWFFTSLLLRMGAALAGFYFVAGAQWQRLLPCLLGFVLARLAVTWLTRASGESRLQAPWGTHAP